MSNHAKVWTDLTNDVRLPMHLRVVCVKYRGRAMADPEYHKKLTPEELAETKTVYDYWKAHCATTP